jgi:hypothetical protein
MYRSNAHFLLVHLSRSAPNQSRDVDGEHVLVPQSLSLNFHLLVECITPIFAPIATPNVAPIVARIFAHVIALIGALINFILILSLCLKLILLWLEFLRP